MGGGLQVGAIGILEVTHLVQVMPATRPVLNGDHVVQNLYI